jgi:hypothetical protein
MPLPRFPAQAEESISKPTRHVAIADGRGFGGIFFTYFERTVRRVYDVTRQPEHGVE